MVTSFHCRRRFLQFVTVIAAFMVIAICSMAFGAPVDVKAQLNRDAVPAGQGAVLTLTISGGRPAPPAIPEVKDLIIEPRGQSQQIQLINGTTTVSVVYHYVVGSNTPGDYQIPAIELTIDGKIHVTQPLKLKVLAAAAAPPPGAKPPNPSGQQPTGDSTADTGEKRFGFLTVDLVDKDRKYVYVGEIAPVCIRAWIPLDARAQLRSGIQPEGKAFTLHHVSDQPQQTHEIKDGKRYLVVTWYGGMSATKAGNYPASLSVDATVAVRDTSAPKPRRRSGGPFDDPFFDSVFDDMNAPMIQKDVTLKSDDQQIEVRSLPTAGRPAGFNGAVGAFKFDGWQIPSDWTTGEPRQILARLAGSGNFALMNAPELTPEGSWKTYPGKSEFTPGDYASFSGNKSFQFSAVPRKGGAQEVALAFSFFDPAAGEFKTITSPPQKIQVAGQDIVDDKPAISAPDIPDGKNENHNLVAQHLEYSPVGSLVPLVSRPAFAKWLVTGAGLCVLGEMLAWLRRRRDDPDRRARAAMEMATRAALRHAAQGAAAKDVAGFFAAARLAIQQRLGMRWNQAPQAITLAEIEARIPADSPVVKFFREADHQAYSHQNVGEMFPRWQTMLDDAMASLTPTDR